LKTLTVKEVAEALNVNYETVLRMIKRGELKATKVGSRIYRITEDELRHYLKVEGGNDV
jgi:excisionase family DNA binding protein